jgi:hypothetical protein
LAGKKYKAMLSSVGLDASKLLGQASSLESFVTSSIGGSDLDNFDTMSQYLVDKCAANETHSLL